MKQKSSTYTHDGRAFVVLTYYFVNYWEYAPTYNTQPSVGRRRRYIYILELRDRSMRPVDEAVSAWQIKTNHERSLATATP